ncbi:MMPL family transporter [soil metagenome]
MRLTSESMARWSARRPWTVVVAWALAFVISLGLAGALLGDVLTTDFDFTDQPESKRAEALLSERLRGETTTPELVVVRSETETAQDPGYAAYVTQLQSALSELGGEVLGVGSYLTLSGPVSEDGSTALLPVRVRGEDFGVMAEVSRQIHGVIEANEPPAGYTVLVAGPGTLNEDFNRLAEEGLQRGETIGIAIALLILIAVFGAVAAAVLPIILAIAAIVVSFGVTALIGQLFELSFFITNMITMIGLAVGIDYSLFVVSRYREERARGLEKVDAIARAGGTASRAVFFSGLIVVLALSSLLLVPATLFQSLGLGAMTVVIIAVAAALTLLPAVLSLMGDRVNALAVRRQPAHPDQRSSVWDRIGGAVMGRPWVSLALSVGALLFFASFYLRIETGFSGVSTLPESTGSRQAFEIIQEEFPAGVTSPVEIVVDAEASSEVDAAIERLQEAMAAEPAFGAATLERNEAGDLTLLSAPLTGDFQAKESSDAVKRLRAELIPAAFEGTGATVLVGGNTAFNVDFLDDAEAARPIVIAWVLALSFLLLMLVFRSIVVPVTSILMNLLSVGAAYGLIIVFFQEGVGFEVFKDIGRLLGFTTVDAVEAWIPLLLFAILFGLSMDYHIFLLSRIKEHYDRTADNTASVAHGLRTTGAIITGAALIMVAVFGGFATSELVPFQQMGFGLAIAVLIDATVIRSVLVPATMRILGDRNWYLPSWLSWLPTLRIEGSDEPGPEPADDPALEPVR